MEHDITLRVPRGSMGAGFTLIHVRRLPDGSAALWWPASDLIPAHVELDRLPAAVMQEINSNDVKLLPRMLLAQLPSGYDKLDVQACASKLAAAANVVEAEMQLSDIPQASNHFDVESMQRMAA